MLKERVGNIQSHVLYMREKTQANKIDRPIKLKNDTSKCIHNLRIHSYILFGLNRQYDTH